MLRAFFLYLSRNRALQNGFLSFPLSRRLSRRFVAGETLEEALGVTRNLNTRGMKVTLNHLGENVTNPEEAHRAAAEIVRILEAVHREGVDASVSVKLTHLGLDLGREIAAENLRWIVETAQNFGNFVRIDMESSAYTQVTLDLFYEMHAQYRGHVGIVIQAYLRRSEADIRQLIETGANVRLCKGAYKEPAEIAFPKKRQVNENFFRLARLMLSEEALRKGAYPAFATHDERLIERILGLIRERNIPPDRYEFQMLYGIRRDLQEKLAKAGHRVRIYVPYGTHWYPYFMRRLAERPANVLFLVKNLIKP